MKLFGAKEKPIAHPLNFLGVGIYEQPFTGSGFGVVFEDDGETGYLYATSETLDQIHDALHLYNATDENRLNPGEEAFIVWNPSIKKVGIYYHNMFQAVVDFANCLACCRNAFPTSVGQWCKSLHEWNEMMTNGLG